MSIEDRNWHPDDMILRPGSRSRPLTPGTEKVRPAVILAGNRIIKAKSWGDVSIANPSGVATLGSLRVRSDTNNSYEGVSEGFKAIINFEQQIPGIDPSLYAHVGLGNEIPSNGINAEIGGTTSGSGSIRMSSQLRVRCITAPFVTAALTWNNVVVAPTITIGSTIYESVVNSMLVNTLPPGTVLVSTNIFESTTQQIGGGLSFPSERALLINGFPSCYGLLIDMQPKVTLDPGLSLTSLTASGQAPSWDLAAINGSYSPFVVLPPN